MKFLTIICLTLLVTACGKNVDENTPNAPTIPRADPGGNNPAQPLPIPHPSSGIMSLKFANHAYDQNSVDQYTIFDVPARLQINFPDYIQKISEFSFNPMELQDTRNIILVRVNGRIICEYSISHDYNLENTSCVRDLILEVGDDLSVTGIPKGKTLTLKVPYQGF